MEGTVPFVPGVHPPPEPLPRLWFCVGPAGLLVRDGDAGVAMPVASDPDDLGVERETASHFLGVLGGQACWCVGARPGTATGRWLDLRSLYGQLPDQLWAVAGRAAQIAEWDRTHRFCGRCGSPTVAATEERAMRCPACGLLAFPRLSPAVIVAVERPGEILLAHNVSFPEGQFSAVAGFVDPGETLEEAVHREVAEEVGVALGGVRYVASQPWPFPHSLMVAFTARWAGGEIRVDGREIADARWFPPDGLPRLPPSMSIARDLIDDFVVRSRGS